jgi:3-oxoadipate enol-lactonase
MPYIDNFGVKIWYETHGDRSNEALVLLTGALLDTSVWEKQVDCFKDRYFIITIDNRGSGKSNRPEIKYTSRMLSEDVELVLYEESVFRFNLAGFSMGGLVAQKLVERNIEKVMRLVLMNSTLGAGNGSMVPPVKEVANMYLYHSMLSNEDMVKNVMDFCFGPGMEKDDPGFYSDYAKRVEPNIDAVLWQSNVLLEQERLIADYSRVTQPVLALFAEDDPIALPANGQSVREAFSDARVEVVPGYHMSPLIQAERVNDILETFLRTDIVDPDDDE